MEVVLPSDPTVPRRRKKGALLTGTNKKQKASQQKEGQHEEGWPGAKIAQQSACPLNKKPVDVDRGQAHARMHHRRASPALGPAPAPLECIERIDFANGRRHVVTEAPAPKRAWQPIALKSVHNQFSAAQNVAQDQEARGSPLVHRWAGVRSVPGPHRPSVNPAFANIFAEVDRGFDLAKV